MHQRHDHGADNIFATQITQSGLATPVLMLLFLSDFMLPLIAALVAGDIVAAEDGNGTLKTILTRSVDRGQVFAAKTAGRHDLRARSRCSSRPPWRRSPASPRGAFTRSGPCPDTVVSAPEGLLLVFAANAIYLIPLLTVACIGVLLSTATRNSAAAGRRHDRRW